MNKILAVLPAAALAVTACTSTSTTGPEDVISNSSSSVEAVSGESSSSTVTTPVKNYPTKYIVTDMGEYEFSGSAWTVTKGSCTSEANKAVWKKVSQTGSLVQNANGTVSVDLGDGEGAETFDYRVESAFPMGDYFLTSSLQMPLVIGFSLTTPNKYTEMIYPTSECVLKDFGEMAETFSEIAEAASANDVVVGCNDISYGPMKLTYLSNDETSIDYSLTYKDYSCKLHHEFLYADSEEDCKLAFETYQKEYEEGETKDLFDFENYDQNINAAEGSEEACEALFLHFMLDNAGNLNLSKQAPVDVEKQVKKLVRAISPRNAKKK